MDKFGDMIEHEIITRQIEDELPEELAVEFFDEQDIKEKEKSKKESKKRIDLPVDYNEKIDGPLSQSEISDNPEFGLLIPPNEQTQNPQDAESPLRKKISGKKLEPIQ